MKRKRLWAWLLLAVLLVGAMLGLLRQREAARLPMLFVEMPAEEAPETCPEMRLAKRVRWVWLDAEGLRQMSLQPGQTNRVVLNLFPDLQVEASVMANKTHWNKDQSAFGLIEDSMDSLMVMSFHQDIMMGVAVLPDGRQVLISHVEDGKYAIIEVDPAKVGFCGNCAEMAGVNPRMAPIQKEAKSGGSPVKPAGGVKTSALGEGAWSRRLAMADPEVLKDMQSECGDCESMAANVPGPVRPLLAAMGMSPGMLAGAATASGKYELEAGGPRKLLFGPASPHSINFQRSGLLEYLDILFIYENDLLVQEANSVAQIQAKVTRLVDSLNAIFTTCSIPIEVRQADLVAGRYRSWGFSPAELVLSGYTGPAWEQVQAPIEADFTDPDPNNWTVWTPTGAQKQAKVGVYKAKYEDISDRNVTTGEKSYEGYLDWIYDRRGNSLLYGDQYWGTDRFRPFGAGLFGEHQEPYINLPEGFLWRLEPDPAPQFIGEYSIGDNPSLMTGPVDHPDSDWNINVEAGQTPNAHAPVARYDSDGGNNTYGTDFNGTYSGLLGLRMDLNGTDYSNTFFTGDPVLVNTLSARYPVLHGQTGDFNASFNINTVGGTLKDARADIVCVLAADALGSSGAGVTGMVGLADKYSNYVPANAARSLGRGPSPQPNEVRQSKYSYNEGLVIGNGGAGPYNGTFSGADLRPSGIAGGANADGLAAYYPFTYNTIDSTANNNDGTMNGDAANNGTDRQVSSAKSLFLDGTGDYMEVPDSASTSGLSNISIGCWVKWDTIPTNLQTLVGKYGAGSADQEFKLEANSTHVHFTLRAADNSGDTSVASGFSFQTGKWYHIFASYDGTGSAGMVIYVDGFSVTTTNSSTIAYGQGLRDSGQTMRIGADHSGANAVDGMVDEVRLYNKALPALQVESLYMVERPASVFNATQGLVAHYLFSAGSFADSSTQGNTGAASGAPTSQIDRFGASANAYELGVGNYITTQTSNGFPVGAGDFTLSLWVNKNTASFGAGNGRGQVLVANNADNQFELRVHDGNGSLCFYTGIQGGSPNTADHHTATLPWTSGQWYHVAVTRTGNDIRFYRDGLQVGGAGNIGADGNNALPANMFLTFGDSPSAPAGGPNDALTGRIDDVRLYDQSLTAANIKDLFLSEKAAQTVPVFDTLTGLVAHYPVEAATDTNGFVTDLITATAQTVVGAQLADGRGGAVDVNGSYSFDGVSNYINLGQGIANMGNGRFVVSFWANPDTRPGAGLVDIIGNREGNNTGSWWIGMNNSGNIVFGAGNATSNYSVTSTGNLDTDTNTWQQVIVDRNSSNGIHFYINGVEDAASGTVAVDINGTGEDLWIGKGGAAGSEYDGKLDGFRIYQNRSIQAWEASALYSTENINAVGTAAIKINFTRDDVGGGESVRLRLYNNNFAETPFFNQEFNASGSSISYSFEAGSHANAWQDKQGAWILSALSGSAVVESVEITVNDSTILYKGTVNPPSVLGSDLQDKNIIMNRDRFFGMICQLTAGLPNYTFAHEIGHVFGAHHGLGDGGLRNDDPAVTFNSFGNNATVTIKNGPAARDTIQVMEGLGTFIRDDFQAMGNHFLVYNYSGSPANSGTPAGPMWGQFCTIMAYPTIPAAAGTGTRTMYTRIPRFSSPNVLYKGVITGTGHYRKLPPPHGQYIKELVYDHTRTITMMGRMATFFRDDNGSGRQQGTFSVPVWAPKGVPDSGPIKKAPKADATQTMAQVNMPLGGVPDGSARGVPTAVRPGQPVKGGQASFYPRPVRPGMRPRGKSTVGLSASFTPSTTAPATPPQTPAAPPKQPAVVPNPPATVRPGVVKPNPRPLPRPNGGGLAARPTAPTTVPIPGGAARNDGRGNSQPIPFRPMADGSLLASINGHNRGATGAGDAAARTADGRPVFHGRSVWWHVVAPATGVYDLEVTTHGSAIDTTLAVWLPGAAAPRANDNDPRRPGPASAVRVKRIRLVQDQRVDVAVDGVNGSQGPVRVNVRLKMAH
ncbi:MAG: hypothetical protein CMO66_06785 [Verrucomicrobiales bacterium]|nr:hypothetical protein [Verrucomicrobiales bacterium]